MEELIGFGLVPFAEKRLVNGVFVVNFTDETIAAKTAAIYAWVINGKVVRIGSCKSTLRTRTIAHERWLNMRLAEGFGPERTRRQEAERAHTLEWKALFAHDNIVATAIGRQGTSFDTLMGPVNGYLAEENFLLSRFRPPLNRNHFR